MKIVLLLQNSRQSIQIKNNNFNPKEEIQPIALEKKILKKETCQILSHFSDFTASEVKCKGQKLWFIFWIVHLKLSIDPCVVWQISIKY